VTFLDDVTEEDLVGLYSGAAASVTPSLQEGFGLPVLEAMACGAPVVCARTTSLPEVAGEASVLVEPTVEGLAAGLRRVLSSVSVREELRRRGLERAAPFTWRRTAEATVASYREAARKRPART
jgi:alpha-1,3-rhamnosyl/mannosyltransferase